MYGVWWWGNRYLGVYFCAKSYATDFTYVRKLVSVASFYRWKKHWGINFLKAAPVLWCSWNETNYKEPVIWYLLCIAVGIQKRSWGVLYLDLSEWGRVGVYSAFKSRKAPWRRRDSYFLAHFLECMPCGRHHARAWGLRAEEGKVLLAEGGCRFLVGKARAGHVCPSTLGGVNLDKNTWWWLGWEWSLPRLPSWNGGLWSQSEDVG